MYNLKKLLKKVVTVKTVTGLEIMGTLISTDDDEHLVVLMNPKMVVLNDNEVAVIPFTFTSEVETAEFKVDMLLSVTETIKDSADDYLKLVEGVEPNTDK
jgi:small nuclear ribonucleoprotein (snRNP)-like protein|tara:strand:+ start:382 stop:681 length:300 start_codon:yes stop_codon:yes gene_type:complete